MRPTGINDNVNESITYDVINYPNPASGLTTISVVLKQASDFDVTVYNAIGQAIQTIKVNGQNGANNVNLDLSNLSAGIYIYTVKVGASSVTKKLIVE
jgi:hypothetical protein